jgi:flagellar protein FlbT
MSKSLHISLRSGERIYINGAVLKADRKVSLELMNDATFLREDHILQPDETTTPLRQLYFVLQTMLLDPGAGAEPRQIFDLWYASLVRAFANEQVLCGLAAVNNLVEAGNVFEALKVLRKVFPIEDSILGQGHGESPRRMEAVACR